jgi:hypothetical protein
MRCTKLPYVGIGTETDERREGYYYYMLSKVVF